MSDIVEEFSYDNALSEAATEDLEDIVLKARAEGAVQEREAIAEAFKGMGAVAAAIRARGEAPGELAAKFKLGQKVREFLSPGAPKALSKTQQKTLPDARCAECMRLGDAQERCEAEPSAIAALEGKCGVDGCTAPTPHDHHKD